MTDRDAELQRVKDACEALAEHFDTVAIFTTRHEPGDDEDSGTVNIQWGSGNWFARYGQIASWVIKQDERTKVETRRDED